MAAGLGEITTRVGKQMFKDSGHEMETVIMQRPELYCMGT